MTSIVLFGASQNFQLGFRGGPDIPRPREASNSRSGSKSYPPGVRNTSAPDKGAPPAPLAAVPVPLRRSYCVPAKLAFLMTLAQRTVSDFT
jgi:hypothetical protein